MTEEQPEERAEDTGKKALAAGALAVGLGGSATVAADTVMQDVPSVAYVFTYDYTAGVPFQAVDRLQQRTINVILQDYVTDPTDYNAYVCVYRPDLPGEFTLVFIRNGSLQVGPINEGPLYTFGTDPNFFISEINMLSVGLNQVDAQQTTTPEGEEETTPEEETPTPTEEETTPAEETTTPAETPADEETTTPAEETTEEVVVETTTTETNGG